MTDPAPGHRAWSFRKYAWASMARALGWRDARPAIAAFLLAAPLAGPAGAKDAASPDPTATITLNARQVGAIEIGTVGTAWFIDEVQAAGNIDFNQNMLVQVFTPYQGRIIAAYPNVGDAVKRGQVLFTIDSPDLLTAESALIAADGVLRLQTITLKRQQAMKNFGGASQAAVDQSTSDQQTAEAALKAARDAVRIFGKTDSEIDKIVSDRRADPVLIVKSPIDGFVTTRTASPGLLVQPGSAPPVYTVADLSTMWMFANVVEDDAPKMALRETVRASVDAFPGKVFTGRVLVLGQSIDPNTRRLPVRTDVEDPDRQLRAGMLANITVEVGPPRQSPAVPADAIVREGDGTMTAWVTTDRLTFTRRTVTVGVSQGGFTEIRSGLRDGEQVVVKNAVFVSNKYDLAADTTD